MGDSNTFSRKEGYKRYIENLILSLRIHRSNKDAEETNPKVEDMTIECETNNKRDKWGNGWEFLMSCIALSVGLGNVWRFPFTALDNGGGAFVIPYIIVLILVGKPVYYLEMVVGQFSSRSSIKAFDLCPVTRGIGCGQVLSTGLVATFYGSVLAIIIRYFVASFYSTLPWSYCRLEWGPSCINSAGKIAPNNSSIPFNSTSSAEFYFYKEVLKEKQTIHDGVGYPDLQLALYLALTWIIVILVMVKGIRSSGKASYFLALFPYVIMAILFIRSVTLPGAGNGILYLFKPQWSELANPKVWYAAVSQVFFSLAVCFGNIIMLASYNNFSHNIHRDATIVTVLDTFTSLFSAITIFGILGNLAHESGTDDIQSVVAGGPGLAFVSYPNAISKFDIVPQLFAVIFFFMLFVLGIGSITGMTTCVYTAIKDQFPHIEHWKIIIPIVVIQFLFGLMYTTPGGQHLLNFIDFFGASFVAFILGIAQLITFSWVYGVKRICLDIEFMLNIKTGWYWRICWAIITPALMIGILIYNLATYKPLTYNNHNYPDVAYAIGWCISAFGILQLPFWAFYTVYQQKGSTLLEKIQGAFKPTSDWGPQSTELNNTYKQLISTQETRKRNIFIKVKNNIFG